MTEPVEQIPWALMTKVTYKSDMSVALEQGPSSSDVWHKDFEWSASLDSKEMIKEDMRLSSSLTRDIQDHFALDRHAGFEKNVKSWLKTGLVSRLLPREGPKEWRPQPKSKELRPTAWKIAGDYGIGNTYNEDPTYFWGEKFEFANLETDDYDQGAVIAWEGRESTPEVYLGDHFDDFMNDQHEGDPFSSETFLRFNSRLENGLMWAWEKLGVFDEPDEKIEKWSDKQVVQVVRAIDQDPSILLPESVEKILRNMDKFPKEIQRAVNYLLRNHRRELEAALGQKLIWGDLYRE